MTVSEIIPGQLYLGSAPCTSSGGDFEALPALRELGITHIVNCTPDFPFPSAAQLGVGGDDGAGPAAVTQHRVPVADVDDAPIGSYFHAAADFIAGALQGQRRVYVHCETGKSRSAAVVLAYQLKHGGAATLRAAWDLVKARRPYAMPKPAFMARLATFAAALPLPDAASASSGKEVHDMHFATTEYGAMYLLDHFEAFGLGRAEVEAALVAAAGEYVAAFSMLRRQAEALFMGVEE